MGKRAPSLCSASNKRQPYKADGQAKTTSSKKQQQRRNVNAGLRAMGAPAVGTCPILVKYPKAIPKHGSGIAHFSN